MCMVQFFTQDYQIQLRFSTVRTNWISGELRAEILKCESSQEEKYHLILIGNFLKSNDGFQLPRVKFLVL